jgi:hypothetical protein
MAKCRLAALQKADRQRDIAGRQHGKTGRQNSVVNRQLKNQR